MRTTTILALVVLASAAPVASTGVPVDRSMAPYSAPGRLVRLRDGRRLHIECMGRGSPTVILSAALGEWSETWRLVQPAIARTTRVCAWDRAGAGFSDGSDKPQTVTATVADLTEALRFAKLSGPYVMVGHSLGGLETLLFADRNPQAVAGMVLVDPSIPDQLRRLHYAAPAFAPLIDQANDDRTSRLRRCAASVANGRVRLGSLDPESCLAHLPYYPKALVAKLSRLDMARSRWASAISLSENFAADTRLAINPSRRYGSMPLIVLSSSRVPAAPPDAGQAVKDDATRLLREIVRAHDELAALSSAGRHRSVPDTGHYIQLEQPAVVIRAINDVVGRARLTRARRPDRLEPTGATAPAPRNGQATPRDDRQAQEGHR